MSEFKRIFEANGANFHEEPIMLLEKTIFEQKIALRAVDNYHWNEKGQAVIAEGLMPILRPLVSNK